jgi:hypothetical protein
MKITIIKEGKDVAAQLGIPPDRVAALKSFAGDLEVIQRSIPSIPKIDVFALIAALCKSTEEAMLFCSFYFEYMALRYKMPFEDNPYVKKIETTS